MDPSRALPPVPEAPRPRRRWMRLTVNLLIVGVLSAGAVFTASTLNQQRIRLNVVNGALTVEQGRFFPVGFQPMATDTDAKMKAYTPIPLRDGMNVTVPVEFKDRTELDQHLFSLLSAWSKELIARGSGGDVALAEQLIRRSEWIPGVSVQQRREIKSMLADLAFSAAKRQILKAQELMNAASKDLEDATGVNGRFEAEAKQWQTWTREMLKSFEAAPSYSLPSISAEKPPAEDTVQPEAGAHSPNLKLRQPGELEKSEKFEPNQPNTVQDKPQAFDL